MSSERVATAASASSVDSEDLRSAIAALLERQAALEAEVALLRSSQAVAAETAVAPEAVVEGASADDSVIEIESAVTRRGWMKAAAAAAVGGTAVALSGAERAAAAPSTFQLGTTNTNADRTVANYIGGGISTAFVFQDGTEFDGLGSNYPGALGGWTTNTQRPTGVFGFTNVDGADAYGVVGEGARSGVRAQGGNGPDGRGLEGTGFVGVHGTAGANESESAGVVGVSNDALAKGVTAHNTAIGGVGLAANGGFLAIDATGLNGVRASASRVGVNTFGGWWGMWARGSAAAVRLAGTGIEPLSRVDQHVAGELDVSVDGDGDVDSLWFCVDAGSPGEWRKLAGKDSAGVLHAITPVRVYDSRRAAPAPGRLSSGEARVVSVEDGRDEATGAVTLVDAVPEHARAVAYNVTVVDTAVRGFLAVVPGGVTESAASSINWSGTDQVLANAGIVQLDDSRQVRVIAGGSGSTNFIIDITGYYL